MLLEVVARQVSQKLWFTRRKLFLTFLAVQYRIEHFGLIMASEIQTTLLHSDELISHHDIFLFNHEFLAADG